MKRIVAAIMVLSLLFSTAAYAEECNSVDERSFRNCFVKDYVVLTFTPNQYTFMPTQNVYLPVQRINTVTGDASVTPLVHMATIQYCFIIQWYATNGVRHYMGGSFNSNGYPKVTWQNAEYHAKATVLSKPTKNVVAPSSDESSVTCTALGGKLRTKYDAKIYIDAYGQETAASGTEDLVFYYTGTYPN